jgi:hypothetical protein
VRLIKKEEAPSPRPIFLDKGVPPFAGHGRFMRLSSEVHRKRRPVLWSDGGVPPCCPDAGVGVPRLKKRKEGAPPPTAFLAGNKEQELVGSLHYEYS